jgi:hypothetical protein
VCRVAKRRAAKFPEYGLDGAHSVTWLKQFPTLQSLLPPLVYGAATPAVGCDAFQPAAGSSGSGQTL